MKNLLIITTLSLLLLSCGKKETSPQSTHLKVHEREAQAEKGPDQPAITPAKPAQTINPHAINPHIGAVPQAKPLPAGHPPIAPNQGALANPHGAGRGLPGGHPPVRGNTGAPAATPPVGSPNDLPLRPSGPGGASELARVEKQFEEGADRTIFQSAFKRVFTPNRRQRDPVGSTRDLRTLAEKYPKAAPIYRVMGYAAVDNGFQTQLAFRMYKKAVELNPNYGEVHYALAFLYVMSDKVTGATHYKLAMKLGVEDQRGIGQRFYPNLIQ